MITKLSVACLIEPSGVGVAESGLGSSLISSTSYLDHDTFLDTLLSYNPEIQSFLIVSLMFGLVSLCYWSSSRCQEILLDFNDEIGKLDRPCSLILIDRSFLLSLGGMVVLIMTEEDGSDLEALIEINRGGWGLVITMLAVTLASHTQSIGSFVIYSSAVLTFMARLIYLKFLRRNQNTCE